MYTQHMYEKLVRQSCIKQLPPSNPRKIVDPLEYQRKGLSICKITLPVAVRSGHTSIFLLDIFIDFITGGEITQWALVVLSSALCVRIVSGTDSGIGPFVKEDALSN